MITTNADMTYGRLRRAFLKWALSQGWSPRSALLFSCTYATTTASKLAKKG